MTGKGEKLKPLPETILAIPIKKGSASGKYYDLKGMNVEGVKAMGGVEYIIKDGRKPLLVYKRICCKCKIQIGGHHKWFFNKQSKAEHRNCKSPCKYE